MLKNTNQPKEKMRIEKIVNRLNRDIKINLIKDMKKDNDLKKHVNEIEKLDDDQFTVLINIFKKINLNN
jgi:hypothetical protein